MIEGYNSAKITHFICALKCLSPRRFITQLYTNVERPWLCALQLRTRVGTLSESLGSTADSPQPRPALLRGSRRQGGAGSRSDCFTRPRAVVQLSALAGRNPSPLRFCLLSPATDPPTSRARRCGAAPLCCSQRVRLPSRLPKPHTLMHGRPKRSHSHRSARRLPTGRPLPRLLLRRRRGPLPLLRRSPLRPALLRLKRLLRRPRRVPSPRTTSLRRCFASDLVVLSLD